MESFIRHYKIDPKLCDHLIKYYKNNTEYKNPGEQYLAGTGELGIDKNAKDSIDVSFYNNSKNKYVKAYFDVLSEIVQEYDKYYGLKFNIRTSDRGTNIQFYPRNGGFKTWHTERTSLRNSDRALVFMTYLNDINDGGETEFFHQKLKVKAQKGLTLLWPPDFTHLHRGIPSPTEEKIIVTGWFEFFQ